MLAAGSVIVLVYWMVEAGILTAWAIRNDKVDWATASGTLVAALATWVAALGTWVAAVGTVRALFYAQRQLRAFKIQRDTDMRLANREHHHRLALAATEYLDKAVQGLSTISEALGTAAGPGFTACMWRPQHHPEVESLANKLELIALAVNRGAVDIGYLNDYMGMAFDSLYSKCAGYIRTERLRSALFFHDTELVVDELFQIDRGRYRVTRAVLAKLETDCLDQQVLDVLRGLISERVYTRDELAAQLRSVDIRGDMYTIMKRCYVRQALITKYDSDRHLAGVVKLFEEMHKDTKGFYPPLRKPAKDDEWHERLTKWLAENDGATRWVAVMGEEEEERVVGHVSLEKTPKASNWKPWNLLINHGQVRIAPDTDWAVIEELYVRNTLRGKVGVGLGRLLLRHALREREVELGTGASKQPRTLLLAIKPTGEAETNELYTRDGGHYVTSIPDIEINDVKLELSVYEFGTH